MTYFKYLNNRNVLWYFFISLLEYVIILKKWKGEAGMKKLYISIFSLFLVFNVLSYSSIVNVINKIDNVVNPKLRFDVSKASGMWYLVYDTDSKIRGLKNITIELAQEGEGYNYILKNYNINQKKWVVTTERAWIQETKNDIYMYMRRKGPVNYKNKILYYDNDMTYLAIYLKKDNTVKILSREETVSPSKIDEIMSEIKKQGYGVSRLKRTEYDPTLFDQAEIDKARKESEFYDRLGRFGESGIIDFDNAVEEAVNN